MPEYDAIELEGMVTTLTVLRIMSSDVAAVRAALTTKVGQMPGFFRGAPVALDLVAIDEAGGGPGAAGCSLPLEVLVAVVREAHMVPVAVRNGSEARQIQALDLGLACLRGGPPRGEGSDAARSARAGAAAPEPVSRPRAQELQAPAPTLVLRQPIRGGQVIYGERRDVIVLASVNFGGELIADGHIHVYGALRGRALAGAHGNATARIFCTNLQADLVSIAGTYLRADELPESHRGKPAQIFLDGDRLVVTDL